MTASQALAEARRRDVDRRRQRVRQALAEMRGQADQITISSVAARARVRRREVDSFRRWHFRSYPLRVRNPGSFQVSMSNRASIRCSKVIPRRCARTRSSSE